MRIPTRFTSKSTAKLGKNASNPAMATSTHGKTGTLEDEEKAFRATDDDLLAEQKLSNDSEGTFVSTANANSNATKPAEPYRYVPLRMGGSGGTHMPSTEASALIDEIGGLATLEKMTSRFYKNAFRDVTLDKFIKSHDDPHARRFATWIHQKLTNSSVWSEDRATRSNKPVEVANGRTAVVHDRSSAHVAAWHSPKRPANEVGRHFELDECRVWMRVHLWAMRETVGDTSPSFTDYYVRFIGHFVSVYERRATAFARDSYRWSANPSNIQDYLDNGRRMEDVLGLSYRQALRQIPEDEAHDDVWPKDRY